MSKNLKTRVETDSLGEIKVPKDALWGAQTQRAIENFPISGIKFKFPFGRSFLKALGVIKYSAAIANNDLGILSNKKSDAIKSAAKKVINGDVDDHFPIDIFQTGSGTSTNMNANEVIANLASAKLKDQISPNDEVNMSQSSNDTIPTAICISALLDMKELLLPGLDVLIKEIDKKLEKKFNKELPIGVCHPGVHSPQTGLVKNAPNCYWLEKKPFQNDLRKELGKEVFCENDANCFALSEALDGAGKHYKIVYGIIIGSGVGGGLVIDKKIVSGPNGVAGEWGHNQITHLIAKKDNFESTNLREGEIESFMSGLSLAKKFNKQYKKNLKTNEIFELYRKHDLDAENLIDNFKVNLAMSFANIINILDPDCFVFGGGVSNEIDFLSEIETIVRKFVTGREYEGVFLKPKYGDASGVRGAARLGRKSIY